MKGIMKPKNLYLSSTEQTIWWTLEFQIVYSVDAWFDGNELSNRIDQCHINQISAKNVLGIQI